MASNISLVEFALSTIPMAIAFLVSAQVATLVASVQVNLFAPLIGLVFSGNDSVDNWEYSYNDTLKFRYGRVFSSLINFGASLAIVYFLIRTATAFGVDARKRL